METLNSNNGNAAILNNDLSFENFVGNVAGYSNDTNALGTVMQFFDSGTPNGVYTFKISAGISGQQISKDVQVLVQSPAPKLDFFLAGLNSSVDTITTGLNNSELGLSTRAQVVTTTADGTFVIEKPSFDGVTYNLSWLATLQNYQSSLVRTSEINEVTNDNLLSNPDSKKLFNDASGIKKLNDATASAEKTYQFNDAHLLVKRGVTVPQPVNVIVKQSTGSAATIANTALTGISTGSGLTVQLATLADLGDAGATATVKIADYSTTAAATLGLKIRTTITNGMFVVNGVETATFDIQVSDFPDVLELGTGTVAANSHYRFVNVNLSVNGPQAIFENFASPRTALLLAANKNGLLLFNATGTGLDTQGTSTTEAKVRAYAGATFNMDTGYNSDPQDSAVDSSGLWRKQLAITNTTVAGVYTLKFSVDNIVKEVKIQINNPTPKVFVMSGIDMLDSGDVDTLKNNSATSLAPSTILSPLHTQYALGGNEFKFATSGTGYNRLQTYDVDGILPGTANYVPSLFDKFVAPNASDVYTVYLPNRALTNRDMLYARIAVADLAKGEYDYEITKKYPDGRVETFSDKVKVTAVDNNQIATFDSTNSKFITNWIINETSFTDGTYEYSFKVNNIEKKLTINVLDAPTFDVTKVLTGTVARPLFNGSYVIAADTLAANTSTTGTALSFEFDKINVTDTQFYSVGYSFLEKDNTTLTGTKALSDTFALISGTLDTTKISSIKDLNKISLGSFRRGTNAPEAGDYIQFNIKIYDAVAKSIVASGYRQAGEDIVLQVLVAATIPLIDKYITVTNDGSITKGQEDGEVLTVRVFGDTFAPGAGNVNITTSNFIFRTDSVASEQPTTVTIGRVIYVDANTVQLVLRGNATNDYTDADVDATAIDVKAGALTGAAALTTKATTLFKTAPTTTQAVVSMTSATTDNGTIIVTLPSGLDFTAVTHTSGNASNIATAGFKVEIVDRFGNATALPTGLTVDTASASNTGTKLTLTLDGSLTALYWTDNQRVRVTIPKTVVETVGGDVDVLADIVVVTTFRDLKPVTLTPERLSLTQFKVTLDDDWYTRSADGTLVYMGNQTEANMAANAGGLIPFTYTVANAANTPLGISYDATTRVFTVRYAAAVNGADAVVVTPTANKIFDKNGNTNATAALSSFTAAA
jgi:5-hydroxyisourate hydrolase-like protein (transthyretin family)